jgi:hypothetical protein
MSFLDIVSAWCAVKESERSREAAKLGLRAALLLRVKVPYR